MGIAGLGLLAAEPQAAAAHLGRVVDRTPERLPDGAWRVASGAGRAPFEYLSRAQLAARHPGADLGGLADEGVAALVLRVTDLAQARRALGTTPVAESAGALVVPAAHANGQLLVLVAG